MRTKTLLLSISAILAVALLSACGLVRSPIATPIDAEAIFTQAAQTVEARVTQEYLGTQQPLPASATPMPSATIAIATNVPPVDTAVPSTATSVPPTATNLPPTATQRPPTPTPVPCNMAQYVKDLSVPDGTTFLPNATFTKTWRLRNVGSCTWNRYYSLIFASGAAVGGDTVVSLPESVAPGETIDLSVDLRAPTRAGRYRSFWMLESDRGHVFGIGENADSAFWVDFKVASLPDRGYAYDFAATICSASWRSSAGKLPCQGSSSNRGGSAILTGNPALETGRTEDELTLITRPEMVDSGWIQGIYPAYRVKAGDHFLADVGCLADSKGCDVTFSLDTIFGGVYRNLAQWHEVYDGKLTRADIDLTSLAGQNVQFVLTVSANSHPASANAFWLAPSIRSGIVPTPTFTPTPTATATPTATPRPTPTVLPPDEGPGSDEALPPVKTVQKVLSKALGVQKKDVAVEEVTPETWKDGCLGIATHGQCAQVMVPGFRIVVRVSDRSYEAHTNLDGSQIVWFGL